MKRILLILLICLLLVGCYINDSREASKKEAITLDDVEQLSYALVVKDINNEYMHTMFRGFKMACTELGISALMVGPDDSSDVNQSQLINDLIREKIDGIAVAANDSDEIKSALQKAITSGISVVSLDSPVYPEDRTVHIQQASPEIIGRILIQAGAEMINNEGEIAILSTTEETPNQKSWVNWMLRELDENKEKYSNIKLVEVAYGHDNETVSKRKTRELLHKYPNLKLIIAPTVIGIRSAAEVVCEEKSSVKVTGLGLPSEMEQYINSGICPWMYLWNPSDLGYLAAYAIYVCQTGTFTGKEGDIFEAGSLGNRIVTSSEDGGTEIVLGKPLMISSNNVSMWKEVF
ncbi:MAG TPA: substrate-binding domain-containing protein [Clostridiaceae bacterium]|nr:substrate-binding domain-containing protein [Clostridiaceae bacterium]